MLTSVSPIGLVLSVAAVAAVAAAAALVVLGALAWRTARRLRDVVRRQRQETHEIGRQVAEQGRVIGALGLFLRLRTVVEEVEEARERGRITAVEGDRLLHHLRRLGDDVTAGDLPY